MTKILVTGADGQLGRCIKDAALDYPEFDVVFASRKELDIANKEYIAEFFGKYSFDYCINTAAYTNVEKAESEEDAAFNVNAIAVKNLSEACKDSDTVLLQVSTDYVFDGKQNRPYLETDTTNPINVYGASKLKGEKFIEEICSKYFIFRTSWLYSQYGHNFLNSILNYAKEGKSLTITTEQIGTPTNANDLAKALLEVIDSNSEKYGLYHFSNEGKATWFDFAESILKFSDQLATTNLAKTDHYRTFAARPKYSVLSKEKYTSNYGLTTENWRSSLQKLISNNIFRYE
jgi:dTDP-4-dehydrorhamnose reductase